MEQVWLKNYFQIRVFDSLLLLFYLSIILFILEGFIFLF